MRYSVETKLTPEKVVEEARSYFINSFGLRISSDEENKLCLEGGGGYVTILVCPGAKTSVEIETREWDRAVKEFMERIHR